mmetsp:Transcript_92007/g.286353  ORF Transcript_92007/g.286353 Transcript_92007/m.286353 type:complete len:236 (-) Transcript_92007:229-936(-)
MLLSALARGRCRAEPESLRRLLAVHLLPLRLGAWLGAGRWRKELQNLALAAYAVVKLDVHAMPMDPREPDSTLLAILAPLVCEACSTGCFKGFAGARSAGLLAHAFGAALLLQPLPSEGLAEVYSRSLQALLMLKLELPARDIRVRFQLLSASQCWWCAMGGPHTPLASLRAASIWGAGPLPGAEESAEGQEWISTKGHDEVVRSLPTSLSARARMEGFAFPFWMDVILPPIATE